MIRNAYAWTTGWVAVLVMTASACVAHTSRDADRCEVDEECRVAAAPPTATTPTAPPSERPVPAPTTPPSEPPPPRAGSGTYETGCADDRDCDVGHVCFQSGTETVCTFACWNDTGCPVPGLCVATTSGGICLLDTSSPPLPFYASGCEAVGCVSGAQCYELSSPRHGLTDTMCSAPCALDSDCGTLGWCVRQLSSSPICFQWCASDADCISGWRCENVESFETRDLVPVCVPG
ncbi:MAG: hypothetical protein IT379_12990 [Deltaproteobacteria bacterium]|nr:hypothetical protein [Deltaproteobacteria bacterium]